MRNNIENMRTVILQYHDIVSTISIDRLTYSNIITVFITSENGLPLNVHSTEKITSISTHLYLLVSLSLSVSVSLSLSLSITLSVSVLTHFEVYFQLYYDYDYDYNQLQNHCVLFQYLIYQNYPQPAHIVF